MREIKFRSWNKKIMYTPEYIDHNGTSCYWDPDSLSIFDSQDDIVMQYTGLKDKNGKEIYEGDIIRDVIEPESTCTVLWNNHGFDPWVSTPIYAGRPAFADPENGVEVIGNIYENPELLKGENL